MEKKRNGIDNFFRENLSDFELSERKSNWELLNHLLNDQESKKKKRRWFLFIFCFIAMLSGSLLVWLPGKKENEKTNNKIERENISAATEKSFSKNETHNYSANIPSINEIVKKEGNFQSPEPGNNSSLPKEKNNIQNSIVNNAGSHAGIKHNTSSEHSAVIKSEINFTAAEAYIHLHDSDKTVNGETKNSGLIVPVDKPANDSVSTVLTIQKTGYQNLILADSSETESADSDSFSTIEKNTPTPDSATTKELIPVKTKFLHYNIYAGVNIYSTGSAFSNNQHLSPIAGIGLIHPVNSNFSIGVAGLYSIQGGYNLNDTATLMMETYFLDKEVSVSQQTIQIRQLHKLYFPLTLYYNLVKKHSVLGAAQFSYLLNTNSNYSEMITVSGLTIESKKKNVKGYMDGIKSTNISLSLGYKYSLSKRFGLEARFTRELTDPYIKEYFYGVNSTSAWSLQTFLIIKF